MTLGRVVAEAARAFADAALALPLAAAPRQLTGPAGPTTGKEHP